MNGLNGRTVVSLVALVAIVGATAAIAVPNAGGTTLVVADAETDERLLEVPVEDGDEVTLAYTHSVEKTPIEDVYVVDGSELRMDRMVFHSHGAGLPSDEEIERTDEGFVVHTDDAYEEIGVVPGSIAGHELVVGDDRYDLVDRADGPVRLFLADRSRSDVLSSAVPSVASAENAAPPATAGTIS